MAVAELAEWAGATWGRARRRYGWLDHLVRTARRYDQADARGTAGAIAFIGLPITGWFWIDSLRSSIRAI